MRPKRILLIDADDVFRYLVRAQLRSEAFDVVTARSGGRGRLLASEVDPDVILLDIGAAGHDLSVLRALLSGDESCFVPVIVMGRRDQLAEIDAALSLGAQDFLLKPVGIGGLGRLIDDHIDGDRRQRRSAEMVAWAAH